MACVDEGIELRDSGIALPILVLGVTSPDQYDDLIKYNITPTVFSMDMARALEEFGAARDKIINVHIKIDTDGMGRIGYASCPGER